MKQNVKNKKFSKVLRENAGFFFILPWLIVFLAAQNQFIDGIAAGGVKG